MAKFFKFETTGQNLASLKITILNDPKHADNFTFFLTMDDIDRLARECLDAYAKLKCMETRLEMQNK